MNVGVLDNFSGVYIRVLQGFWQVDPENPRILSRQSTAKWRSAADADFSTKKLCAPVATH
jgi:hypothetical protein